MKMIGIRSLWRVNNSLSRLNVRIIFRNAASNVDVTEQEFHRICDDTLEHIQDRLMSLEDNLPDAEISCSQSVLSINLGPKIGAWVINKQTPNRQIWWSSPISGPRRYEYIPQHDSKSLISSWRNSKDGSSLQDILSQEMLQATGLKLI